MSAFKTAEDMAGDIARKIEKGEWPDGYRLPPERELAATYGLARNTVRRALDQLDDRVVRLVGRGTYVKSLAAKGTAEFEHWDAALHLAIFRAAKNALLVDYCEAINAARNQPHWYRLKQRSLTEERRRRYDSDHSAIVAALLQRDAEAARRLQHAHLARVRDNLMSLS